MRKVRRLSDEAAAVLRVFTAEPSKERFGLELIRLAEIDSGSLYPILHRFEEREFLLGSWEDFTIATEEKRRPRRKYQLNPHMADRALDLLEEWRRARGAPAPRALEPNSGAA